MQSPQKHILFCVLNWGLGHASRSIPIIAHLIGKGYRVTIASDGTAAELLQQVFPHQCFIDLPSYRIVYGRNPLRSIVSQIPRLLSNIRLEQVLIRSWLATHPCDLIISDNRYGAYARTRPSILITHQLNYPGSALWSWLAQLVYAWLGRPFTEFWVPDLPAPESLSGVLSHNRYVGKKYNIGPWSALPPLERGTDYQYDVILVLSGPEPNRSWLQNAFVRLITANPSLKAALICGSKTIPPSPPYNLHVFGLVDAKKISSLVGRSRVILSRSGYSSIMDWALQGLPVVLIPTPGQPEQDYLAQWLTQTYAIPVVKENELERCLAYIRSSPHVYWPRVHQDSRRLQERIDLVLGVFD